MRLTYCLIIIIIIPSTQPLIKLIICIHVVHKCVFIALVLIQIVAETSLSTDISISTEPSVSGSTTVGWRKGNTNECNDELTYVVIAL